MSRRARYARPGISKFSPLRDVALHLPLLPACTRPSRFSNRSGIPPDHFELYYRTCWAAAALAAPGVAAAAAAVAGTVATAVAASWWWRRCGSCAAALGRRRRSPARWSSHARAATACKWPRSWSVVRMPEPHNERAMGAALTPGQPASGLHVRTRSCVRRLTISIAIGAAFGYDTRAHVLSRTLTRREASQCAVRPQSGQTPAGVTPRASWCLGVLPLVSPLSSVTPPGGPSAP